MAKKVFYNRRYKMPGWGQPYAVWGVVAFVTLGILFFTSVERIAPEPPPALPVTLNGFAEGLFYELRDAEAGTHSEVILSYARRLEKKHGYKVREERNGACKSVAVVRGGSPAYGVATALSGEKSQGAFALLTFLDRLAGQNPGSAISTRIFLAAKECDIDAALSAFAGGGFELPVILEAGDSNPAYDRIPELKNLKIRRYFEPAFFTRERTLWANTMALLRNETPATLVIPVAVKWAASPEAELAQNPLLRHPAVDKNSDVAAAKPVGLYLAADYQLTRAGFFTLSVLLWLLALLPLVNALGTFREKFDLGSALTSTVLYSAAFFGYFLLLKAVVHFARADFAVILLSVFLLPVVFIPVRILQKNMLRAELNRAGLHVLIQLLLTVTLFTNPLVAWGGFILLVLAAAFTRADIGRKLLRLLLLSLFFGGFYFVTRQPLGSFANFFSAFLPALSLAGISKIVLLSLIGGNLVALFFVPRERV